MVRRATIARVNALPNMNVRQVKVEEQEIEVEVEDIQEYGVSDVVA